MLNQILIAAVLLGLTAIFIRWAWRMNAINQATYAPFDLGVDVAIAMIDLSCDD